jgi:hypothetical protein
MRVKATVFLILAVLLAFGATAAMAQPTTHPGLFFTIVNRCNSAASGFAVGDKLCLLQIGTATYTRGIFQGTMASGEKKSAMACTGKDGKGSVLFVPAPGSGAQAVLVAVSPNQAVDIPSTFCDRANAAAPGSQLLNKP